MDTTLQPWKVISSKSIHSTPWLSLIEDRCQINGRELVYTYVKRVDEGPLIVPETADGKLWMVRQYRHPIKKILWQFPVEGKLKAESWEAAAQRGLQEELQLSARTLKNLGQFYPDPGSLDQKYTVFLAQDLHQNQQYHQQSSDEVEDLEIASFSRKEIDQMIQSGEIADNWTLTALYVYDKYVTQKV
jgi:ADP-ribose pyrophosphatase